MKDKAGNREIVATEVIATVMCTIGACPFPHHFSTPLHNLSSISKLDVNPVTW